MTGAYARSMSSQTEPRRARQPTKPTVSELINGGIVEVRPDVCWRLEHQGESVVGLIAQPGPARGWVEMTSNEAREVGRWLIAAADETDKINDSKRRSTG